MSKKSISKYHLILTINKAVVLVSYFFREFIELVLNKER